MRYFKYKEGEIPTVYASESQPRCMDKIVEITKDEYDEIINKIQAKRLEQEEAAKLSA